VSRSPLLILGGICVPPTVNYFSTSLPAQHLLLLCLFICHSHSLKLSLGFHLGPDNQCRLFQTFAKMYCLLDTSAFSALQRLLTITVLYKSMYLLTYLHPHSTCHLNSTNSRFALFYSTCATQLHTHTTVLLLVWNMSGSTRVSSYIHGYIYTIVLQLFWILSGTTWVSRYQKGKTRKAKPIWIYWSKR